MALKELKTMIKIIVWVSDASDLQAPEFLPRNRFLEAQCYQHEKNTEKEATFHSPRPERKCVEGDLGDAQRKCSAFSAGWISKVHTRWKEAHNPGWGARLMLGHPKATGLLETDCSKACSFSSVRRKKCGGGVARSRWWRECGEFLTKRKMAQMNREMRALGCAESGQSQENCIPGNGAN